jgi:porin
MGTMKSLLLLNLKREDGSIQRSFLQMSTALRLILIACWAASSTFSAEAEPAGSSTNVVASTAVPHTSGVSANPAAANITTGTGEAWKCFEELLGIEDDHGVRLGGAWIGNMDWLISGGADPGKVGFNSLLILDLLVDFEKATDGGWKGGSLGAELLQFNGAPVNDYAGTLQDYDSLSGPPPLDRTQLYELWIRQEFLDEKLVVRLGKSVPTYDFGNVTKPVTLTEQEFNIPSVSGLLYTPIHKNPTMIGVMPGYYNSAYGMTTTFEPVKWWYLSHGIYDGNQANHVQTGLVGPRINGYYFNIVETGCSWRLGGELPGKFGVGYWNQTGDLREPPGITEDGTQGFYLFGSQRVWYQHPGKDNSGISTFFQYGKNDSETLIINESVGAGLTGFGLVPNRPKDSMGAGAFLSFPNPNRFQRSSELMVQGYYQANIWRSIYVQPAITYIPTPGAGPDLNEAWIATVQVAVLF